MNGCGFREIIEAAYFGIPSENHRYYNLSAKLFSRMEPSFFDLRKMCLFPHLVLL